MQMFNLKYSENIKTIGEAIKTWLDTKAKLFVQISFDCC